jgi:3-deoxy-D-manno-octulosonic-acid transferase
MNHYDIAYAIGGCLAAPLWLIRPAARRKVRDALDHRMGRLPPRPGGQAAVMIHAVSLGEINATRELIRRLRQAAPAPLHFIVSTTTQTGFARGQQLYGDQSDVTLVRFPLDFSWAVSRLLDNARPSVVALMELEIWPNFLRQCRRRGVPVILINGRLTAASFFRYRLVKPLARSMFGQLRRLCAQDAVYAQRFIELGADPQRVSITGTMKFDTAGVSDQVAGADELAAFAGLTPGHGPIWVCGSTGPGEERIILGQYRKLLERFADLRLVISPRKPERFDQAAREIAAAGFTCLRRSAPGGDGGGAPVILGDTMGELRAWYSLADVVLVGRTLVDLGPRQHGSDMIEPAALGKPVLVGPYTGNFAEPIAKFLAAEAMVAVADGDELSARLAELLGDRQRAALLGRRARQVVISEQGATDRHVQAILQLLPPAQPTPLAAADA